MEVLRYVVTVLVLAILDTIVQGSSGARLSSHPFVQAFKSQLSTNSHLSVHIKGEKTRVANNKLEVFEATVSPESAHVRFYWSCVLYNLQGKDIGQCVDGPKRSRTQDKLVINTTNMPANVTCVVTVTVTSDTGALASSTVSMTTRKQSAPLCSMESEQKTLLPGSRVTLVVTCMSRSGIKEVTWSTASTDGSSTLDLTKAIEDSYTDSLPDNMYKSVIVIGKDFLMAGKKYNIEARVKDGNSAETRTKVALKVMDDITGGELICPESYEELNKMSVTMRKTANQTPATYTLYVQTPGGHRQISGRQNTGDFTTVGPQAHGQESNVFVAEICSQEASDLCKKFTCKVPKVVSADNVKEVSTQLVQQVEQLRKLGRALEAAVLLSTVYEKTKDNSLITKMLDMATHELHANAMNDNSAGTFLNVLLSIPPKQLTRDQVITLTASMTTAADFFIKGNKKVPERFVSALDLWVVKAEAAGLSQREIHSVAEKAVMAEASGLELGNSNTHDLSSSRVTSFNDLPGNSIKVKDDAGNDIRVTFGQSVREKVDHQNLKFKVRAYKTMPSHVLEPPNPAVAPVVDMSFFDINTGLEKKVTGLTKPASIHLPLNADHETGPVKCMYWCPMRKAWVSEGVETGVRTGISVECRTSHFSTYTVIHATHDYNRDHNTGWILGTVLALIIAMILIIIIIVYLVWRIKRRSRASRVDDSSRPPTPLNESPGKNDREKRYRDDPRDDGRNDRRNGDESDGLTRNNSPYQVTRSDTYAYDQRPGSGDGMKRGVY